MRGLAIALALLLALGSARADDGGARDAAARLLDEGVALYTAKQYREALAKFQQAYTTFASPKILFNIAGALDKLGREAEAAQTYDRFLADVGDAADLRDRVASAREALAALDRRLARLRIALPAGSRLVLDGLTTAVTPRPIYVAPGRHALEATIDGAPSTATIDVAAGEERVLEARAFAATKAAPAAAAVTTPTVRTVRPRRVWTWVAAGAGVGLFAGGAVAGTAADSAFERYRAAETVEAWERERAATKQRALIANVCFVGAGLATVGAAALFFVEGRERRVVVTAPAGGVGAAVVGRF